MIDLFGRKRIAELEAEKEALASRLRLAEGRPSFVEVAKDFKIASLPEEILSRIAGDMKQYVVPEFHGALSRMASRQPHHNVARALTAFDPVTRLYEIEVSIPSFTTRIKVASDYMEGFSRG